MGTAEKHSIHSQVIVHILINEYVIISEKCVSYRPAFSQMARYGTTIATGGKNLTEPTKNLRFSFPQKFSLANI